MNNLVRELIFQKFLYLMHGERKIVGMQFQQYCKIWNDYNVSEAEVRFELNLLCEEGFIKPKYPEKNPVYLLTEKGLKYFCP